MKIHKQFGLAWNIRHNISPDLTIKELNQIFVEFEEDINKTDKVVVSLEETDMILLYKLIDVNKEDVGIDSRKQLVIANLEIPINNT